MSAVEESLKRKGVVWRRSGGGGLLEASVRVKSVWDELTTAKVEERRLLLPTRRRLLWSPSPLAIPAPSIISSMMGERIQGSNCLYFQK